MVSAAALVLYVGSIFWTIGYDTIYAHQDREDDALIGVKSTALKLGKKTAKWLVVFYGVFFLSLIYAGMLAKVSIFYYTGTMFVGLHLLWQIKNLDIEDTDKCLALFKSNVFLSQIYFLLLLFEYFLSDQILLALPL